MSKPNQPSKPRQLIRKLITIHSAPGRSRQAVISVIPIAVSLVTMGLIVSPTHAAMGMIGAMGALAGNNNAPLSRARILFGVGTATIFSQCLGLMSVQIEWLLPIILASWSLIVIWVWHALQLGPPGRQYSLRSRIRHLYGQSRLDGQHGIHFHRAVLPHRRYRIDDHHPRLSAPPGPCRS